MNTIAIERDWVVTIADGDPGTLRALNSQMRRIDLFCKLVGPLVIAFVDGASTTVAVFAVLGMTAGSVFVEYFTIQAVYLTVPALQSTNQPPDSSAGQPSNSINSVRNQLHAVGSTLAFYFTHSAFLPSFSLALLYFTVLSFSGQMVAYLLAIGLDSPQIGLLRLLSTVLELSATCLAPVVMNKIGPVRAGIWFVNWQIICVVTAVGLLWTDVRPLYASIALVAGVIASRVGLWGFDLSAQIIVQEEVEPDHRGSFSALEASFQNAFELLAFASTIVFPKPEQFRYPAVISAAAVASAGVLYALFVRQRRGHLLHASPCLTGKKFKVRSRLEGGAGWRELPQWDEEESRSQERQNLPSEASGVGRT
ncbi:hypothetical protein LTR66_004929 [Elasticomyces elasticus]|nr:hypothetical protein LTR66_004929 [Elasticomyces elasticus]